MKKILSYLAYIIGVGVLVVILDFFMHSNKAIEGIFLTLIWLLIIVLVGSLILGIVLLAKKKTKAITKTVILCIANFLGFCVLGTLYFFSFDIQWGLTWQAVTFGLPLLAGMALLVIDTISMIKKKSIKRGFRGFGVGWSAFIYTVLLLMFFNYLVVGAPRNGPKETVNTEENRILEIVLKEYFGGGPGYVVIEPNEKYYWSFKNYTPEIFESVKVQLINQYKSNLKQEPDEIIVQSINSTFEKWVVANPARPHVTLESSPKDGYYIDYDGKFSRYFDGGGGWIRWRLFRPGTACSVDISIPAYDPETGIIVMYIGTQGDYLAGAGYIFVAKYTNNDFEILSRDMVWIS